MEGGHGGGGGFGGGGFHGGELWPEVASMVVAFMAAASLVDSAMVVVFAAMDFTIMTSGGAASGSATAFTNRMTTMTTTVTTIRMLRAIHTTTTEAAMWLIGVCTPRMAGACDRFKCAVDGTIDVKKAASMAAFFVASCRFRRRLACTRSNKPGDNVIVSVDDRKYVECR